MKLTLSLIMAVVIGLCFTPAWAQQGDDVEYLSAGLQNQVMWVTPHEFMRMSEDSGDSDWGYQSDMELYDDGDDSDARWRAAIHLPDGARIVNATWSDYVECGTAPDNYSIDFWIRKITPDPGGSTQGQSICYEETFTKSGYVNVDCDFAVPGSRTIRNSRNYYVAIVEFDTGGCSDRNQRFSGLRIVYRLQMSPAPASHTFGDVYPTDWYYQAVEALAASGITQGCDPHNFCPDRAVTRAEMAAFLARALGLYWAP